MDDSRQVLSASAVEEDHELREVHVLLEVLHKLRYHPVPRRDWQYLRVDVALVADDLQNFQRADGIDVTCGHEDDYVPVLPVLVEDLDQLLRVRLDVLFICAGEIKEDHFALALPCAV